jgi:hypothetical protein
MTDWSTMYISAFMRDSDINTHLPIMSQLARDCKHVTEFGVRWGTSTVAWLTNDVALRGYDIEETNEAEQLFRLAKDSGKDAVLHIRDINTLDTIEETDILFLDSLHTYAQVASELRFAPLVRRYIIFHDTELFGCVGEDGGKGILPAIFEFWAVNQKKWRLLIHTTNNNGLTVLERIAA